MTHPTAKAKVFPIRLRKGDTVIVRSGKYKGQTGIITAVHPTLNKVTVEGINIVKKHMKPSQTHPKGGIIEITKPIWVSKVGLIDPKTKKASRVGYKLDGDKKIRILKKTGKEVTK